jgi:multidrug efflux pump subunit AcrB
MMYPRTELNVDCRLALNRPYTFVVLSLLIVILSGVAIVQTPVDIFPDINIPVVGVIMNYSGLAPQDMQDRLANVLQRNHNDGQRYRAHGGAELPRRFGHQDFLQPNSDVFAGMAQISASTSSAVRGMPPGTIPPFMIAYSAADVPILQIGLSSKTLSEQQLQDLASNFLRTRLATIQGAELPGRLWREEPAHYRGSGSAKTSAKVDLGRRSRERGQRAEPGGAAGTEKIGGREYDIALNSSAKTIDELNDVPVKVVNGAMIYLRDVAYVHDGASFQTNIARNDGHRGVLLVILKHGKASTLDIVASVRAALPKIAATLPPDLEMTPLGDQSIFVRATR